MGLDASDTALPVRDPWGRGFSRLSSSSARRWASPASDDRCQLRLTGMLECRGTRVILVTSCSRLGLSCVIALSFSLFVAGNTGAGAGQCVGCAG